MFNLSQPLAHINAYFELDGEKYEVEHFQTGFAQPTSFRGQPMHETQGGVITLTLTQIANDNLYQWAKKSTALKSGSILFQTDLGITILRIIFTNAYCVGLTRDIDAVKGTSTILTISPELLTLNGIEHDNFWPTKNTQQ